ncbi:DarT ssDNA thymidine ADP-ribosyltransferase family protein (plasmid) [Deinococcus sp. VB343]|uniref:DarT ssDNA thymidine ADP-ribosyltransferase family protein n=1 Tax=Deinococcus sp. VB142 TaxID=3112952 RepID=A0AAU6Q7W9_9DEIO
MAEKWSFRRGEERLFGTAYEFAQEADKDQVLEALRSALGTVDAMRSFASAQRFDGAQALVWLKANVGPVSPELAKYLEGWQPIPRPVLTRSVAPTVSVAAPKPKLEGVQQAPALAGFVCKIWLSGDLIGDGPLRFASEQECEIVLDALRQSAYKLKSEAVTSPDARDYSGTGLLSWLVGRRDVNVGQLRRILTLPLTPAEIQAEQEKREEAYRRAQQRRWEDGLLKAAQEHASKQKEQLERAAQEQRLAAQRAAAEAQREQAARRAAETARQVPARSLQRPNQAQTPSSPARTILPAQTTNEQVRRTEIRRQAESRGIQFLVHFTRLENLVGIMANGICSRQVMRGRNYIHNDDVRLDGRLHANCLSISHPNYKMFWNYRSLSGGADWVVLRIHPRVLWELDCGFTEVNAAKRTHNIHLRAEQSLKTVQAFVGMFDCPDPDLRHALDLQDYETTDPQAEVLVFETIPPEYIAAVCVNKREDFSDVRGLRAAQERQIPVVFCDALFRPRHDYRHWLKR